MRNPLALLSLAASLVAALASGCGTEPSIPEIAVGVLPSTASVVTGRSQNFLASVANDPGFSGVTWSVTGCTGDASTCGTLTVGADTLNSNLLNTHATYTAPQGVPPGPLGVMATSVADPTKSFTASVAIVAGLSINLAPTNSGDQQTATVGTALPQPLRVLVRRGAEAAPGVTVRWAAAGDTLRISHGSLSATTTTTDASGIASVNWTLGGTAGTQSVSASISDPAVTADSIASFTAVATPGPASTLRFAVNPGYVVAGQPMSVQVAAVDAFDNVVNFSGGVFIALGPHAGGGVLSGTTQVGAVAGTATFSDLRIDWPGTGYTLVASASGLGNVTSAPFDVRLPPGSVTLAPTLVGVDLGTSVPFTATVTNDPSNAGVTWTLTGPGCSGTACGTLSTTSSASGVPVLLTAPATVPVPATVTLIARAVADTTASASATAVITTPGQVTVYLVPSSASVPINGTRSFIATVFNDPAGAGVIWTLSGIGTLSASSSASGVPVTYNAPGSVGSATIKATSVTDPSKSATASVSVIRLGCVRGCR